MDSPIESLTTVLTTVCNLNCTYCYREETAPRQLTWSRLSRALDWAVAEAGNRLEVVLREPYGVVTRPAADLQGLAVLYRVPGNDLDEIEIRLSGIPRCVARRIHRFELLSTCHLIAPYR